jgi:hypothetical protein
MAWARHPRLRTLFTGRRRPALSSPFTSGSYTSMLTLLRRCRSHGLSVTSHRLCQLRIHLICVLGRLKRIVARPPARFLGTKRHARRSILRSAIRGTPPSAFRGYSRVPNLQVYEKPSRIDRVLIEFFQIGILRWVVRFDSILHTPRLRLCGLAITRFPVRREGGRFGPRILGNSTSRLGSVHLRRRLRISPVQSS